MCLAGFVRFMAPQALLALCVLSSVSVQMRQSSRILLFRKSNFQHAQRTAGSECLDEVRSGSTSIQGSRERPFRQAMRTDVVADWYVHIMRPFAPHWLVRGCPIFSALRALFRIDETIQRADLIKGKSSGHKKFRFPKVYISMCPDC